MKREGSAGAGAVVARIIRLTEWLADPAAAAVGLVLAAIAELLHGR